MLKTAKEEVREILERLPEDVSLEDIQYHIYVREKIERGLRDVKEGRVLSQEEVELLEEMTGDLAFGIHGLRLKERQSKAETALRNSEEQYSKLVAAIPDFVINTDMSGNMC